MNGLLWTVFVVIAVVTVFVGFLTLSLSVFLFWFDGRRTAARAEIAPAILTRLDQDDPEWDGWYRELSLIERYVARQVVASYLRRIRGHERAQLVRFAEDVGIVDHARSLLGNPLLFNRLRGLVWLTLLEYPVSIERLRATSTSHPETRAAAARLLAVSDAPEASQNGTALLCWSGEDRLSTFGLDTLYQLNNTDATALLTLTATDGVWWDEGLLVQALTTLGYCQSTQELAQFEWLLPLLEHDSPRVRSATLIALGQHGWRWRLRDRIDVERALTDPEPQVRTAAYDLFSRWGDSDSIEWLQYGVVSDPDERSRLAAVRFLNRSGTSLPEATDDAVVRTIDWVRAEHATQRRVTTGWT
ncbi:uncharacterized protein Nmag_1131 [Natrialba magadii ATCC 43099]|uniref:HEAT repeat protein n=1 Tax=Natrialba magadii (strain ATCC 43099 / DSM 3394 / CCM 3739 / CIP 104546 / IAM 13178 / JCM 8861 / NBRC 102185 / NCIMB 2190 / MS3) TaxID=547559 RepID=D3SRL0_NATMM|nr:HEAT repeat domain-containing protein [Natrialba magadii]ADD04715.1 uncharacterized protein Nmag_1131 [Natrialba magadii ATCC 43099]ELY25371.1 hypothetical protein C500_18176 [Natrialba magadii ATCC 43099]